MSAASERGMCFVVVADATVIAVGVGETNGGEEQEHT